MASRLHKLGSSILSILSTPLVSILPDLNELLTMDKTSTFHEYAHVSCVKPSRLMLLDASFASSVALITSVRHEQSAGIHESFKR